jgi:hypothetical protein
LRIADCGLRIADCGLRIADCVTLQHIRTDPAVCFAGARVMRFMKQGRRAENHQETERRASARRVIGAVFCLNLFWNSRFSARNGTSELLWCKAFQAVVWNLNFGSVQQRFSLSIRIGSATKLYKGRFSVRVIRVSNIHGFSSKFSQLPCFRSQSTDSKNHEPIRAPRRGAWNKGKPNVLCFSRGRMPRKKRRRPGCQTIGGSTIEANEGLAK